jgi:hypothetical protein
MEKAIATRRQTVFSTIGLFIFFESTNREMGVCLVGEREAPNDGFRQIIALGELFVSHFGSS